MQGQVSTVVTGRPDADAQAGTGRRQVLLTTGVVVAAAAVTAACGSSGSAASAGAGSSAGASGTTVPTSDVPVGGGVVLADAKVVVTQPTQGSFKAFSAVCTHQGCVVASVSDGTIHCPCHGSAFSAADGSVQNGPASAPLSSVPVTVNGSTLTVG